MIMTGLLLERRRLLRGMLEDQLRHQAGQQPPALLPAAPAMRAR